ncbi:hypothetical protein CI109_106832 [Kwoniella shandongensis]|uniref:Uncharacterized protein n=1 Tax=Kwoniella shandongensis TaxID=1734106 RepID=A0A5M6CAD6_9TREE|nr:uncharacterized protein CI109_000912 [Kwoniella shandongensis]KAA5530732.1 hypothetical protein CI109_000912 [Kwoniella shandongensis]
MSSNGTKLSFSFAAPGTTAATPASTSTNGGAAKPLSNFELLMAKAKAPQASTSTASSSSKVPPRAAALFSEEDDDDHPSGGPPPNLLLAGPSRSSTTKKAPQTSLISRSERKAQEAAKAIDQSIFDYDNHYDAMKLAEQNIELSKKKETEERKPKYIESFLRSAETRRLDKLRAEEKMLARERENEGEEFEGKEKFVTGAYKKQMEEVRLAEEEEKKREEAIRKGQKGPGLTAFYKSMLDTDEAKHAAAVAATAGPSSASGQGPSLAIKPPTAARNDDFDDQEEYDPLLAREAKASGLNDQSSKQKAGSTRIDELSGKEVEVNDEGEVVDKRSLLKAGLNIMKKPKPELPSSLLTSQRSKDPLDGPYKSRAVGTAASYAERMERERRRLADQMRDEAEKKKRDEEERLRREEEEARKRREGDDGEAERKRQEAKERYLARKRAREEGKDGGNKKAKDD